MQMLHCPLVPPCGLFCYMPVGRCIRLIASVGRSLVQFNSSFMAMLGHYMSVSTCRHACVMFKSGRMMIERVCSCFVEILFLYTVTTVAKELTCSVVCVCGACT